MDRYSLTSREYVRYEDHLKILKASVGLNNEELQEVMNANVRKSERIRELEAANKRLREQADTARKSEAQLRTVSNKLEDARQEKEAADHAISSLHNDIAVLNVENNRLRKSLRNTVVARDCAETIAKLDDKVAMLTNLAEERRKEILRYKDKNIELATKLENIRKAWEGIQQ